MNHSFRSLLFLAMAGALLFSCEEVEEAVDDVQKTAALRNVTVVYDSLQTDVVLPQTSLEGSTFDELYQNNKDKFSDPANYVVELSTHFTVDNTKDNAEDAKFSGMYQDIVFNNIDESPVRFETPAFEIAANNTKSVSPTGEINLETHRKTALYIFKQIIEEKPLDASIMNKFLYDFGSREGEIDGGTFEQQIPTQASDETKEFLSGLIESGIFDPN